MAYLFDGPSEKITISGVTMPTTGALFLLWYPTSNSFSWDQTFFSQAAGFNDYWRCCRTGTTNFRNQFVIGGGVTGLSATISAPSLNTWYSVCVNWTQSGTCEIFIDNVSIGTAGSTAVAALTDDMIIGNSFFTGPAMGRIAEVSLYDANLDSTARTSLHGLNIPSQGAHGLHYWPLDGNANDSWGSAHGTVTDATTATHPTMNSGGGSSTFRPQVTMIF